MFPLFRVSATLLPTLSQSARPVERTNDCQSSTTNSPLFASLSLQASSFYFLHNLLQMSFLTSFTQHPWRWLLLLASLPTLSNAQGGLIGGGNNNPNSNNNGNVLVVGGFVDTQMCHQNLVTADQNGNGDGKIQADEFVEFSQLQAPGGELDNIDTYQTMPLVMQATFVTLTCMCRDQRFGGDPRDVNCCLGVDAHIAIVGNDDFSTSQEVTRLFATCLLTDQAIQQVLGSEPPSAEPTMAPSETPTFAPSPSPSLGPTQAPSSTPTNSPTVEPTTAAPITPNPTASGPTVAPTCLSPAHQNTTIRLKKNTPKMTTANCNHRRPRLHQSPHRHQSPSHQADRKQRGNTWSPQAHWCF